MKRRAILFIDGNNFYHGMKELGLSSGIGLDYEKLSKKLVLAREWIETRYYIGRVKKEGDLTRYEEQRKFLRYLEQFNQVRYFLGRIESRRVKTAEKLARWLNWTKERDDIQLSKRVEQELWRIANAGGSKQYVEKAVDVMIATDMVSMAYENAYDDAYLLTADGDFTPAVREVQKQGKRVFVASPSNGYEIANAADKFIRMRKDFFSGCWI